MYDLRQPACIAPMHDRLLPSLVAVYGVEVGCSHELQYMPLSQCSIPHPSAETRAGEHTHTRHDPARVPGERVAGGNVEGGGG